jgi:hypothetical protein
LVSCPSLSKASSGRPATQPPQAGPLQVMAMTLSRGVRDVGDWAQLFATDQLRSS